MFDIDRDGKLNEEEIRNMAEVLLLVYKQYDDVRFCFLTTFIKVNAYLYIRFLKSQFGMSCI